jgi:hypothetical protein
MQEGCERERIALTAGEKRLMDDPTILIVGLGDLGVLNQGSSDPDDFDCGC